METIIRVFGGYRSIIYLLGFTPSPDELGALSKMFGRELQRERYKTADMIIEYNIFM